MSRLPHYAGLPLSVVAAFGLVAAPAAQELTPNPGAWRPVAHADLKAELPDNLTYIDIWKDAIAANNQAYDSKGMARADGQNAPASDAHVVVRSPQRTVVLTTLDTETACKTTAFAQGTGVAVKMCPTRLVIFEGAISGTRELPASCYLEIDPAAPSDPNKDGSFAAYDTVSKTIKMGLIVNHEVVDECSRFIPTVP
jgi:hypothetical protein